MSNGLQVARLLRRLGEYHGALASQKGSTDYQALDLAELISRSKIICEVFLQETKAEAHGKGMETMATLWQSMKNASSQLNWNTTIKLVTELVRLRTELIKQTDASSSKKRKRPSKHSESPSKEQNKKQSSEEQESEQEVDEEDEEEGNDWGKIAAASIAGGVAAYASVHAYQSSKRAETLESEAVLLCHGDEATLGMNADLSLANVQTTPKLIALDAQTIVDELCEQGVSLSQALVATPTELLQLSVDMETTLEEIQAAYQNIRQKKQVEAITSACIALASAWFILARKSFHKRLVLTILAVASGMGIAWRQALSRSQETVAAQRRAQSLLVRFQTFQSQLSARKHEIGQAAHTLRISNQTSTVGQQTSGVKQQHRQTFPTEKIPVGI